MKNVVNWGNFYFDINKMEANSTQKKGDVDHRQYNLDYYDMVVDLKPNVSNAVKVKFKNV